MKTLVLCVLISISNGLPVTDRCNLSQEKIDEIQSYKDVTQKIFNYVLYGNFSHRTWDSLAKFCDKYGDRVTGSQNLENAIDYMVDLQKKLGLENVHKEEAQVPRWVR